MFTVKRCMARPGSAGPGGAARAPAADDRACHGPTQHCRHRAGSTASAVQPVRAAGVRRGPAIRERQFRVGRARRRWEGLRWAAAAALPRAGLLSAAAARFLPPQAPARVSGFQHAPRRFRATPEPPPAPMQLNGLKFDTYCLYSNQKCIIVFTDELEY